MTKLALALLLLLSAAAAAAATFEFKVEANHLASSSSSATPLAAAPSAPGGDPQPQKSAACEAVKAESCALCDHLGDPIAGCGLATTTLMLEAVNAAVGPDVGVYSVVVDAKKTACSVEADMPNEGGTVGGCRLLGGMAYAVAACPVGRVPVGVACVAVDDENQSTPVKGTTQATILHTAQCGFPVPFPPPFGGARAAIILACQPVEVQGSDLMKKKPSGSGALPASVEELLKKAGTGPLAQRQRAADADEAAAAAADAAAEAAKQQQTKAPPKVAQVVTVAPKPAPVVVAPKKAAVVVVPATAAAAAATTTTKTQG